MTSSEIISLLPYSEPFLFVDQLEKINENGITGSYTFPKNSFFYGGHFKEKPVTPGVILSECMAQIGVVCLGIYLLKAKEKNNFGVGMDHMSVDFFLPVLPGEKVMVTSEKRYFRFNKLKCKVEMHNEFGKLICKGEISGMIKSNE